MREHFLTYWISLKSSGNWIKIKCNWCLCCLLVVLFHALWYYCILLLLSLRSMMFNRFQTSFFCWCCCCFFLHSFSLTVDIEIMPRHCKDKTTFVFFVYYYILLLLILLFALFRHTIQMIEFIVQEFIEWKKERKRKKKTKKFSSSQPVALWHTIFGRNIVWSLC